MGNVYAALVHYPVRDRAGDTITTAVTNIDVHDLARSIRTYDLSGYFIVSPIDAQQAIIARIVDHWTGEGAGTRRMPERKAALELVRGVRTIEEACAEIERREGRAPRMVATAARPPQGREAVGFGDEASVMRRSEVPSLILFGTGHGLTHEVLAEAESVLEPIRAGGSFNHLSVRAATAIVLDRLFGEDGVNSGDSRD